MQTNIISNSPINVIRGNNSSIIGTTTRGIFSKEETNTPYAGFSICHYCGDTEEHYKGCRKMLAELLAVDRDRIVIPRQTHSNNVITITNWPIDEKPEDVDAVVTNVPNLIIGINTADCVPIILVDESSHVIASVHAGWRGVVARIASCTIEEMCKIGSNPNDIIAYIGPCIHENCFEVGEEVANQFSNEFISRKYGTKPHINLIAAVKKELVENGIRIENIIVDSSKESCTRCNPDRYFSARALGINSGRNFTFAMLK